MSDGPILLGAGGTGGHLFPAEALAAVFHARGRRVVLVTDKRAKNFSTGEVAEIHSGTPTGKSWPGKIRAMIELARGVVDAWRLISRLKPAAIVGFGGYPSLPLALAAILRRVPLCLHEQNAVLGKANRLLVRYAKWVAVSFADVRGIPAETAVIFTGNPVRAAVAEIAARPYPPLLLEGDVRLLVFGGSQGARLFTDCVPQALGLMPQLLRRRFKVAQQVHSADLETVRDVYGRLGVEADLRSFFDDMPEQLAAAHLVISRGGASTVAELTAAGRPSLIAPYPHHADRHQLLNALNLVQAGAGWVLPDGLMTPASLALKLTQLISEPGRLAGAAAKAKTLFRPDAASALADAIERLAPRNGAVPLATRQAGAGGLMRVAQ